MKTILAVLAVIIIVGGVGIVVINNKDDSTGQNDENSQTSQPEEQEQSQAADTSNELDPSNYTEGANVGDTLDATGQKEVAVSINDFIFNPTLIKIKKGTKVTWTNEGNIGHTVTSSESSPMGGLASELLANGQSYSFTFDTAGTYTYYCSPHPYMKGTVEVTE